MAVSVNQDIEKVVKSLKTNRFAPVEFVEKAKTAARLVLDMIPLDATVGIPGSTSIRQLGLAASLRARGTRVTDINAPSELSVEELLRQTLRCDILLTSSNALTLDGKLVNIDGTGNRVAGMIFGPRKVILIIGVNKIVSNVDEAIKRIKNVIAPYHARTKGDKTPCAVQGHCIDCRSLNRICNVITIIEKKPKLTDIAIIIVGEDLGLGWDPNWPQERKDRIASVYRETRKGYSKATQSISL